MIPLILALVVSALIAFDIIKHDSRSVRLLPIILFSTFTFCWLFFAEFRNKMTKVIIEDDFIVIKKFAGLADSIKYHCHEIDGFRNSMNRSRQGGTEYLHIMKQGRKVGTLSEFHHENYWEMKQELSEKIRDLGFES
jgi:hypothetical protein